MVSMRMEYQPMGDVLSGSVPSDAPLEGRHHEELDADTFVEWAHDDSGDRRLVSFRMLHARTRTDDEQTLDRLPEPIKASAREFFIAPTIQAFRVQPSPDSIDIGELAVPLAQLTLADISAVRGTALDAEMLADELHRLSDALDDLPGSVDEVRVQRLAHALRELASALELSEGLAAPGATAAVRAAVRGGVPFTSGERRAFLELIDQLDDPTTWPAVVRSLETFIDEFDPGAKVTE